MGPYVVRPARLLRTGSPRERHAASCPAGASSTVGKSIQRTPQGPRRKCGRSCFRRPLGNTMMEVESGFQFRSAIAEAIPSGRRWLVARVLIERAWREELAGGLDWAE